MSIPYDSKNVFAKILREELPSQKIWEDEMVLAIMDIMPRAPGHALVIPKYECRNIFDCPENYLVSCIKVVQKLSNVARDAFRADGVSVKQFNELAGGQVVFHLHFHVIPRFDGQNLLPSGIHGDEQEIAVNAAKWRRFL